MGKRREISLGLEIKCINYVEMAYSGTGAYYSTNGTGYNNQEELSPLTQAKINADRACDRLHLYRPPYGNKPEKIAACEAARKKVEELSVTSKGGRRNRRRSTRKPRKAKKTRKVRKSRRV